MNEETLIRGCFAAAREVTPREQDLVDALARVDGARPGRGSSRPRKASLALAAVVLVLATGAMAVEPVRATLSGVAESFADYFGGDLEAGPGREPVAADDLPPWLGENGRVGQRVLAANGDYRLFISTAKDGSIEFSLDETVLLGGSVSSWREELGADPLHVLGTTPGGRGMNPLFGLTAASVDQIEVSYAEGPVSTAEPSADNGFIAILDTERQPTEVAAFDAQGTTIAVEPLTEFGWAEQDGD